MALIGGGPFRIGNPALAPTGTPSYQILDAVNDGAASILRCQKTGTISHLCLLSGAQSGNAPTYIGNIETVLGRVPSGSVAANTGNIQLAASSWIEAALTAGVNVSAGQQIAAVIRGIGGMDASNYSRVATNVASQMFCGPWGAALTAGSWGTPVAGPVMGARYEDGEYVHGTFVISGAANDSWHSGGSPLIRGIKWTAPWGCRLMGVELGIRVSATSDFELSVYGGSDAPSVSNHLVTTSFTADQFAGATSSTMSLQLMFASALTLTAGTAYRMVVRPTTTAAITRITRATWAAEAPMKTMHGGASLCTAAGLGSSWVDYDNAGDGYVGYPFFPIIDAVESGSGVIVVED